MPYTHHTFSLRMMLSGMFALFISSLIMGCTDTAASPKPDTLSRASTHTLTVYLVRHAEKQKDGTSDPALTPYGTRRAQALAELLQGVKFTAIHSTDYQRTRDTARPTLRNQNHIDSLSLYSGNDLPLLADKIRSKGGIHLVVGHSNTTAEVATYLTGKTDGITGPAFTDADYDRLYVVSEDKEGSPTISIISFNPGPEL